MALDKTKIFGAAADLYIAARSSPDTEVLHSTFPGTAWKDCGYLKAKTLKVSTDLHEVDLHTGEKQQLGATVKYEAEGLECDATKFTQLESFLNTRCDVIIKARGSTRHWKLLGVNVSHKLAGTFAADEVLTVPISGQVTGAKVGDCFDEITLI